MRPISTTLLGAAAVAMTAGAALANAPAYPLFSAAIPGENGLPFDIAITNESPSINNNRDVALAFLDAQTNDGVYVQRNGIGQVVRLTPAVVGDVDINDSGDAVWREFFSTPDGVYASLDNSAGSSVLTTGPLGASDYSRPQIDEQQRVGYRAGFFGGGQAYTSFVDGSFNIHATNDAADVNSPYSFLYTPSFNDNLQIAGKADTAAPGAGASQVRIFNADGSSLLRASTTLDDPTSPFGSFDNSVSLNNNGAVAFTARDVNIDPSLPDGVFVSDGLTITEIATTLDPMISDIQFFAPRLSDAGIAAFIADDMNGEEAIFAGDGDFLTRVLGTGDAVSTPFGTKFVAPDTIGGNIGINDQGDIVFNVIVNNQDGSTFGRIIGVAQIPAPSAAATLGLAGLAALRRRR